MRNWRKKEQSKTNNCLFSSFITRIREHFVFPSHLKKSLFILQKILMVKNNSPGPTTIVNKDRKHWVSGLSLLIASLRSRMRNVNCIVL